MGEGQLITFICVGLISGLLFARFVRSNGLGMIGSVFVAIAGAIIVGTLLPFMGINLGTGLLAPAIHGIIGAVILLSLLRVLRS